LAGLWGISLIEATAQFQRDISIGLDKTLVESGRLFINSVGGYFGFSDMLLITDTKEIGVWALPEEKLRIISWPNGEHFYAKVGNMDVVIDGKQKWDTKAEAQAAGERFLANKTR